MKESPPHWSAYTEGENRMRLKEVIHQPPAFVRPDTPLWRVAREMKERQCEFLPVVDRGVPVGSVTMRDLAMAIALEEKCPYATRVWEIMSESAVSLEQHAEVEEAASVMRQSRVRRLVVTDEHRILRGVVTDRDIEKAERCHKQFDPASPVAAVLI